MPFLRGVRLPIRSEQGMENSIKENNPFPVSFSTISLTRWSMSCGSCGPLLERRRSTRRVGHFARHHAHFPQRDFDGFVGNFNLNWAVTGQTRITAGWARDLFNFQVAPGQFQNSPFFEPFSASYASANRVFFAPVWQITEKVALRLRYDYSLRDYLGAVVIGTRRKSYRYPALGFDRTGLAAAAGAFSKRCPAERPPFVRP